MTRITPETILKTRQHFVEINLDCIQDAMTGETFVIDLETYVAWRSEHIANVMAGKIDHTFTFLQRAHWIQTGECIPLLN